MNKFNQLFAMLVLLIGAVALFTSCNEEEDGIQTIYYSMGWESFSSSSLSIFSEMTTVEDAFTSALGVEDTTFTLEGTTAECDATVVAACETAEESLEGTTFSSTATFVVSNVSSNEIIYTYTIN